MNFFYCIFWLLLWCCSLFHGRKLKILLSLCGVGVDPWTWFFIPIIYLFKYRLQIKQPVYIKLTRDWLISWYCTVRVTRALHSVKIENNCGGDEFLSPQYLIWGQNCSAILFTIYFILNIMASTDVGVNIRYFSVIGAILKIRVQQ